MIALIQPLAPADRALVLCDTSPGGRPSPRWPRQWSSSRLRAERQMLAIPANQFRLGDRPDRCRSCGSSLPPFPTDPPPPMTSGLALFFLIIGSLMVAAITTDPSWTLADAPSVFEAG